MYLRSFEHNFQIRGLDGIHNRDVLDVLDAWFGYVPSQRLGVGMMNE